MITSKSRAFLVPVIAILLVVVATAFLQKAMVTDASGSVKKTTSLYKAQSTKICKMLNKAYGYFQAGHIQKAHDISESAYWDVYDNILEIKYRPEATPAYIFGVESKFHALSAQFVKPVTGAKLGDIQKRIAGLCKEIKKEANELTKNS